MESASRKQNYKNDTIQGLHYNLRQQPEQVQRYMLSQKLQQSVRVLAMGIPELAEMIIRYQQAFFLRRESLLPLTNKELAEYMGVHESTVSRALKDKYIQHEGEIYPFSCIFCHMAQFLLQSVRKLTSSIERRFIEMKTWAFIYKTAGCSPEKHFAELLSDTRRSLIYGVSTIEDGCKLAKELMDHQDCKLIELCGGFGEEGARLVIEAVNGQIPVGYIDYFPEEREKLVIMRD